MPHLKSVSFFAVLTAGLGALPALAGEADSPWHSFIGVQGGLYDSSDAWLAGAEGGVGYQTGPLVHYLFVGAGEVNRDAESPTPPFGGLGGGTSHSAPDLAEFEFGYRAAHRLSDKIIAFAECGYESLSASDTGTDALGNPVAISYDSRHTFIGAGVQMQIWNGIHLDLSCRYLSGVADEAFGTPGTDLFGNPILILGDTPKYLVKLGVSYCF